MWLSLYRVKQSMMMMMMMIGGCCIATGSDNEANGGGIKPCRKYHNDAGASRRRRVRVMMELRTR